jgi:predicted dehydrogenase
VGEIARVNAQLSTFVERPGPAGEPLEPVNDDALLAMEFANGASGMVRVSAVSHVADRTFQQHVRLYGAEGTLELDVHFGGPEEGAVIRGARHEDERFRILPVPDELWGATDRALPFWAQVTDFFTKQPAGPRLFVDAILQNRPHSPSFYDGWKAQEIVDAALESHRSGGWAPVQPA